MKSNFVRFVLLGSAVLMAAPGVAMAQQAAEKSFTFKRVTPPKPGTRRLINIQIEPRKEPERVLDKVIDLPGEAPRPKSVSAAPKTDSAERWFWARMSPEIKDAGYGKMAAAMQVLLADPRSSAPLAPAPETISRIVETYGAEILRATAGTNISPALVVAVIATESAGRPKARSSAGARGLMQLMPATAARFGVKKIEDPSENIAGGTKYLSNLLERFKGDSLLALAAYNAGEGAVERAGGVPDYDETRRYVPKVVAAWQLARQACLRPPERATDGCLFRGARVASE